MQTIEDYLNTNSISRSTLFLKLKSGEILSTKINGTRYILDLTESEPGLKIHNASAVKEVIKSKRSEWDTLILQAKQTGDKSHRVHLIEEITADLERFKKHGFKITGYDKRSIYRKISTIAAGGKLQRKTRDEQKPYRNEILQKDSNVQLLLNASSDIYLNLPTYKLRSRLKSNLKLVVDRIIDFAKRCRENEDYWEYAVLADIPPSTMRRTLYKEFSERAFNELHEYKNHFGRWKNRKVHVAGAFTDDQEFMDYIIGDDHKGDIDKVLVWNPLQNKYETKAVKAWAWMEGLTQKVLGYTFTTGELNAEDLVKSLIPVFKIFGKPKKYVLLDNGIGHSTRFEKFLADAEVPWHFAKPHDPTGKSPVERMFKYWKEEFDVFFPNYVGSNHPVEGKHPTASLSAPKATVTFEQYIKQFENYAYGFYETRPRKRVIKNKAIKASIRELFDSYYKYHEKLEVDIRKLRYGWQHKVIKTFDNKVILYKNGVNFTYLPADALSLVLNDRKYIICYDPTDMSEIDMYNISPIADKHTGEYWDRNQLVATLYNMNAMPPAEKMALAAKLNKQRDKKVKELARVMVDSELLNSDVIINSTVKETGKLVNERKQLEREAVVSVKTALPVEKISDMVTRKLSKVLEKPNDEVMLVNTGLTEEDWNELN
jgi:hypothetical protein